MGIQEPFTVEALETRIENQLDKSQESVQEISRWLIKNQQHGKAVVQCWVEVTKMLFHKKYSNLNFVEKLPKTVMSIIWTPY
jgi:hypothetical protein